MKTGSMMKRFVKACPYVAALIVGIVAGNACAANNTWTGADNPTNYNTAANWSLGWVPKNGDAVYVTSGTPNTLGGWTFGNGNANEYHFQGGVLQSGHQTSLNGGAVANVEGGTWRILQLNGSAANFSVGEGSGSGTINLSSGKVEISNDLLLGSGGLGTINQTGGTLTNILGAGTIRLGYTGPGVYTISGGAVYGNLTGAHVSPKAFAVQGSAPLIKFTSFDVNSNSTTRFTLDAGAVSPINVSGAVTLGGLLEINLTNGAPTAPVITLINKTAAGAVSGTWSNAPAGTAFTLGTKTYKVFYSGGDGNDVVLGDGINTWTAAADPTNYNVAANWSLNHVPADGEMALITNGTPNTSNADNGWTFGSGNAKTYRLTGGLLQSGHPTVLDSGAVFNLEGGTWRIRRPMDGNPYANFSIGSSSGNGIINLSGGTLDFSNDILFGNGRTGIINQTGGSITNSFKAGTFYFCNSGPAYYTISGNGRFYAGAITPTVTQTGRFEVVGGSAIIRSSGQVTAFGANQTWSYQFKDGRISELVAGNNFARGGNLQLGLLGGVGLFQTYTQNLVRATSLTGGYVTTNPSVFTVSSSTTNVWAAVEASQRAYAGTMDFSRANSSASFTPKTKGWVEMTTNRLQTANMMFKLSVYTNAPTSMTVSNLIAYMQSGGINASNIVNTWGAENVAVTFPAAAAKYSNRFLWDFSGIDTNVVMSVIAIDLPPLKGTLIRIQ